MELFYYYLIAANIVSFITMLYDKRQARKHLWRVPEARLFILALLLGSPGILLGMYIFRHKTKHAKFVIGIPVILIAQLLIIYWLFAGYLNL